MTKPANTVSKPKRTIPKSAWKKGDPSPNPKGRPRDGESWSAIIKAVGDMYSADLLAFIGTNNELGRAIAQYPQNVQIKYLVVSRVMASLMFDPSSSLFKELLDRIEGKVTERIDMTSGGEKVTVPFEIVKVLNDQDKREVRETSSEPKP